MKLRVDGTPEELKEKAPELVKSLGDLLRSVSPDMADALEKAIPHKEKELKFPVLRALQKQTEIAYEKQMDKMLKDIGKVLDRSLKTSIFKKSEDESNVTRQSSNSSPTVAIKMMNHFEKRTKRHIEIVRKYCDLIAESGKFPEIIHRGEIHDQSKYGTIELEPYVYLAWRYKCADDGNECKLPSGMEDRIHEATMHHILNNRHHPEFHQNNKMGLLNKEDRDKPPSKIVDATNMMDGDIAEMVADWCAMSEERGGTPRGWADKNVNIRWKFTDEQADLIYHLIDSIWKSPEKSPDYTNQIVAKDEKSYEQIKAEFIKDGYTESDFEVDGKLHGYSTNQLIDIAREKKDT